MKYLKICCEEDFLEQLVISHYQSKTTMQGVIGHNLRFVEPLNVCYKQNHF